MVDSGSKQTLSSPINTQMTDNGDGTYSYSYSVQNDGAVTVVVKLVSNSGVKTVWYNNSNFSGSPGLFSSLPNLNLYYGYQCSGSIGTNNCILTAIFSTKIKAPTTDTYTFNLNVDDGSKLWLNGVLKINKLYFLTFSDNFSVDLTKDQFYDLIIYFYNGGGAYQ